jgi:hypothetical protein
MQFFFFGGRSILVGLNKKIPKPEYLESTIDHGQATGQLYHLWLRVECTLFYNLQSRVRTHAVLVMGLYELLDPMT